MREEVVELARILFSIGAIKFGEFTLTSGAKSPVYVDLRLLPSHPREFQAVIRMLDEKLRKALGAGANCIVGVATAGIVWASVLAYLEGLPLAYVRKERKEHGTRRLVEGRVEGCKAVIVDDVATTGSSLASAVEAVRGSGGETIAALVIVDREQGASERLAGLGVTLYRVATLREILEAAAKLGLADADTVSRVLSQLYGRS